MPLFGRLAAHFETEGGKDPRRSRPHQSGPGRVCHLVLRMSRVNQQLLLLRKGRADSSRSPCCARTRQAGRFAWLAARPRPLHASVRGTNDSQSSSAPRRPTEHRARPPMAFRTSSRDYRSLGFGLGWAEAHAVLCTPTEQRPFSPLTRSARVTSGRIGPIPELCRQHHAPTISVRYLSSRRSSGRGRWSGCSILELLAVLERRAARRSTDSRRGMTRRCARSTRLLASAIRRPRASPGFTRLPRSMCGADCTPHTSCWPAQTSASTGSSRRHRPAQGC